MSMPFLKQKKYRHSSHLVVFTKPINSPEDFAIFFKK
jgi:hypothetical protein